MTVAHAELSDRLNKQQQATLEAVAAAQQQRAFLAPSRTNGALLKNVRSSRPLVSAVSPLVVARGQAFGAWRVISPCRCPCAGDP